MVEKSLMRMTLSVITTPNMNVELCEIFLKYRNPYDIICVFKSRNDEYFRLAIALIRNIKDLKKIDCCSSIANLKKYNYFTNVQFSVCLPDISTVI